MLCGCPSLRPSTTRLQMHNRHFTARLGVMEPGWACGDGSPPDGVEMGDLVGFTRPRGLRYDTPAATAPHSFSFCFDRRWDADFVSTQGCANRFEWMKNASGQTSNEEGLNKSSSFEHHNSSDVFYFFTSMLSFRFCGQIRNKKCKVQLNKRIYSPNPIKLAQHMCIPPISFKLNPNTTWLCWYFDWTFEARGGWSCKWRVVDNVNTLWLDWACWVAKGQGGALRWLLSKDSQLKFLWSGSFGLRHTEKQSYQSVSLTYPPIIELVFVSFSFLQAIENPSSFQSSRAFKWFKWSTFHVIML